MDPPQQQQQQPNDMVRHLVIEMKQKLHEEAPSADGTSFQEGCQRVFELLTASDDGGKSNLKTPPPSSTMETFMEVGGISLMIELIRNGNVVDKDNTDKKMAGCSTTNAQDKACRILSELVTRCSNKQTEIAQEIIAEFGGAPETQQTLGMVQNSSEHADHLLMYLSPMFEHVDPSRYPPPIMTETIFPQLLDPQPTVVAAAAWTTETFQHHHQKQQQQPASELQQHAESHHDDEEMDLEPLPVEFATEQHDHDEPVQQNTIVDPSGYPPPAMVDDLEPLPLGQQLHHDGPVAQQDTDLEMEDASEVLTSLPISSTSGHSNNGAMETGDVVEVNNDDAAMIVTALAKGPSFDHYENDRSDCRLLLILRGQNIIEFPALAAVMQRYHELHTTTVPLLQQEAKRRMKFLPKGQRHPPSNMSKCQLETWLSSNPAPLEEDEKPFFQFHLNQLAQSLELDDAVFKDFKFKTQGGKFEKIRRKIRELFACIARFFKRKKASNKSGVFALDTRDEITIDQVEAFRSDPNLLDGVLREMEEQGASHHNDPENLIRGCELLLKVASTGPDQPSPSSNDDDDPSDSANSMRQAIVSAGGISVMAGLIQERENLEANDRLETPTGRSLDESGHTELVDDFGRTALEKPGQAKVRRKACAVLVELSRDPKIKERIIEEFGGIDEIRSTVGKRHPECSKFFLRALCERPERVSEEGC